MGTGDSQRRGLYRIRWRGNISGPYALDQIVLMIRDNELSKHHEISADGRTWKTLLQSGLLGQPGTFKPPNHLASASIGVAPVLVGEANHSGVSHKYLDDNVARISATRARCGKPQPPDIMSGGLSMDTIRAGAIVLLAVAPLAISVLQSVVGLSFAQVAWLFSAYFCILWGWIIGLLTTGYGTILRRGVGCSIFTCFIGIVMLLIWQEIPWISALYAGTESESSFLRLVGFVGGVGIMEELCKASPLLLFCMAPGTIKSNNDGLLLGLLSGLGFAVREGVQYTMSYWTSAVDLGAISIHQCVEAASNGAGVVAQDVFEEHIGAVMPQLFEQYGQLVSAQLIRFMTLPVLHAAWAALVGYAVAYSLLRRNWTAMLAGLGIAALLHGVYNYFSNSVYGVMVAGLSLAVPILLYRRIYPKSTEEAYG